MPRIKIREIPPKERVAGFDEVSCGYDSIEAQTEAKRCLLCKIPQCVKGCPANVDIPGFIAKIRDDDPRGAIEIIKRTNNLPAVCGRVCPSEYQCEKSCILSRKDEAIAIGALERYSSDNGGTEDLIRPEKKKRRVAIIGSGPAGLTCAADLAKMGYETVIFEALHSPGGVLMYGIPEFRLPKKIVKHEIELIKKLGCEIKLNQVIGRTVEMHEIMEEFDCVFVGIGAGVPSFMDISGEHLNGVYSANEFLTRVNLMKGYRFPEYKTPVKRGKKTIVVGGGNVAIDCARAARRLGSDVTIAYRRTFEEMPARKIELLHAKEEGINFMLLTNPVRILGDKHVTSVELIRMELLEPDSSGRRRPKEICGSEFLLDADQVIIAIGQGPNPILMRQLTVEKKDGYISVDAKCQTSTPGLFAGGDIASGSATVIKAIGDGKKAAKAILEYLINLDQIQD